MTIMINQLKEVLSQTRFEKVQLQYALFLKEYEEYKNLYNAKKSSKHQLKSEML